ncbi:hypothetical protein GCM10010278_11420 [Streptomyces melanogenes]|nr:hypothetical protein GCM10010278_11420 [Streptomyces melanogenes]
MEQIEQILFFAPTVGARALFPHGLSTERVHRLLITPFEWRTGARYRARGGAGAQRREGTGRCVLPAPVNPRPPFAVGRIALRSPLGKLTA